MSASDKVHRQAWEAIGHVGLQVVSSCVSYPNYSKMQQLKMTNIYYLWPGIQVWLSRVVLAEDVF